MPTFCGYFGSISATAGATPTAGAFRPHVADSVSAFMTRPSASRAALTGPAQESKDARRRPRFAARPISEKSATPLDSRDFVYINLVYGRTFTLTGRTRHDTRRPPD